MTKRDVILLEATADNPAHRFTINWARNQDGWRVAKQIAKLIQEGHEISVAQTVHGYFIDGSFWPTSVIERWRLQPCALDK